MPSLPWFRGYRWGRFGSDSNNKVKLQVSTSLSTERASVRPALSPHCRKEFLSRCWNLQLDPLDWERELQKYDGYFSHYEESCLHPGDLLEDCTHEQFCNAVKQLVPGTRASCETAIQQLLPPSTTHGGLQAASDCIDFVAMSILMIDVRGWTLQETFAEFIMHAVGSKSTQVDQYRIPQSFNARTFTHVAGIDITWSRDLLSHLETGIDGTSLAVFHNIHVLQLFEHSSFAGIFPSSFLEEARRTIWLMLPMADRSCRQWFKTECHRTALGLRPDDCRHLRAPQRNIQDFEFWRDRLIIAKDAFDRSQPKGLFQFWRDDRNRVQWWTFWIAVVVFLLTLVGVVESALQVYKAYYPSR